MRAPVRAFAPLGLAPLGLALVLLLSLVLGAQAQTSCTQQATATLLSQFSDAAGSGTITPANIRNVICSDQQVLAPGAAAVPQVLGASPFSFVAPLGGTLVVSNGQVQISRNNGGTFYTASLSGGQFVLLAQDQAVVTWFSSVTPVVTWMPQGQ